MFARVLILLLLGFMWALKLEAETFTTYVVDRSVFQKYPAVSADYLRLQETFERGDMSRAQHRLRLAALQKLMAAEPAWLDGYWLYSAETFVLAATYDAPKDYPQAMAIMDEGIRVGEKCLEQNSQQILCKFFLASLMAKKASLEGIFASLRYGARIHALWMDVLASPYDFWFRPNASLQGAVRYGLGIFYRLVPNRWLMQTMFHIRGNLDRSVALHREAVAINPEDPCARLMLGTSLLCRCRGNKENPDCREGAALLESAQQGRAFDANQRLCQHDVDLLLKENHLACGYTQALQVSDEMEKAAF